MPPSTSTAPVDRTLLAAGFGDPTLLALALSVAIVSCWLALKLFWRVTGDRTSKPGLTGQTTGSAALGCGIWAAHFIALLALSPGDIDAQPGPVLLSMVPGVLASFAAFFWLRHRGCESASLAVAGVLIGTGIASVQQATLMALRGTLAIHLAPAGIALSLLAASGFAVLSLFVALGHPKPLLRFGAEGRLTLAGVGMVAGVLMSHALGLLGAETDLPRTTEAPGDNMRVFIGMSVALVALVFTAFVVAVNAFVRYREVYRDVNAKETWQRALLDTAVDGVIAFDIDGRIVDCNAAAERIFGWNSAEMTGRGIGTLIPVGDSTRIELRQLVDQVPEDAPAGVTREVQGLRRDGSIVPLRVATGHAQLRGKDRFVAFVSDMSARKAMEQALRDSETQMRSMIGNVPGIVYRRRIDPVTEHLGSFVFMSEAVARITGLAASEFLGERARHTISELVHADDLPGLRASIAKSVTDRLPFSVEYRLRHVDGQHRWVWSQGGPVAGPDGRLQWLDGAMLDITERRGMESELREAKDRAERAAEARSAFLANMSHEIRTPMNSILGFTEVLLQGELAADQRRHLDTVRTAGKSLLRLLGEILDTAKLDRGAVELEYADFDLLALVDELSSSLGIEARRKELTLEVRFDAALDRRVHGDPLRVRQVLTNLIANAVKFTERGGVVLSVEPDATTPGHLHFEIRDTGIGIPAHRLEAIFDPFIQADASMSRRFGGTGLGTTISKKLVELMGGRIDLESQVGVGSSFHVRMPFGRARAEATPEQRGASTPTVPLPPLHVLIADDVPQNIELLGLHLALQGHRTTSAVNGAEAARLVAGQRFDLVLMDVQMPELDGLQATRRIREHERLNGLPRVPVIALTASVLDADRRAAGESGMDGFASKPVDIELLTREMARVLKIGTAIVETTKEPPPEPSFAVLDTEQGLARWMHRQDAYRRELRRFVTDHVALSDTLADAVTRTAYADIAALAHRVRGAAANLGIDRVANALQRIEHASRSDRPQLAAPLVAAWPPTWIEAMTAIDLWLAERPSVTIAQSTFDPAAAGDEREVQQLCDSMVQALRRGVIDDIALARLTASLQGRVDPHLLRQWRQSIDDFDFVPAEHGLLAIVASLAAQPSPASAAPESKVDVDLGFDIEIDIAIATDLDIEIF